MCAMGKTGYRSMCRARGKAGCRALHKTGERADVHTGCAVVGTWQLGQRMVGCGGKIGGSGIYLGYGQRKAS